MALPHYQQHPDAAVAYPIDVIGLGANTISGATATVSPSGLTLGAPTVTGKRVTVLASAGSNGVTYQVTVVITLSNGEKPVQEFEVEVKDN